MPVGGPAHPALLPVVLGVALTGSLSWTSYVTKQVFDAQEQLAIIATRLDGIDKRLDTMAKQSDIRDLRIVIREALASALSESYNRKRP